MPVNKYFNNNPDNVTYEQRMLEDLVCEQIRIFGYDLHYLPREKLDTTDKLFGENVQSYFDRAYIIDMYIDTPEGWSSGSEFFSKWGVGAHDNISFVVAKRTFNKIIPSNVMLTPRQGDLIYSKILQEIFEITFVDEDKDFFVHGQRLPYTYVLKCEAFRSSNEIINVGVPEIDALDDLTSWTVELTLGGVGNYDIGERVYQGANLIFSSASAKVSEWDGANNKIYLTEVVGQFEPSSNVIGYNTHTSRRVTNEDTMGDHTYYDLYNNRDIQIEANVIIDTVETNPFGAP